jgi:ANTAR domain/GAF domain
MARAWGTAATCRTVDPEHWGDGMAGEQRLSDAFIALADTLHPAFAVEDLLGRLARDYVELLDASASRVILVDDHDRLGVVATADPASLLASLPAPHLADGPGPESHRSGQPVACPDLDAAPASWEDMAAPASAAGLRGVHAWPLRHRDQAIGAVEVYHTRSTAYADHEVRRGGVLATVATISILRERRQRHADALAQQLQNALDSRLVIEQAKGILAERAKLTVDQAFLVLRAFARRRQMRLATLARQVIDGTLDGSLMTRESGGGAARDSAGASPDPRIESTTVRGRPTSPAKRVVSASKPAREHTRQRPPTGG